MFLFFCWSILTLLVACKCESFLFQVKKQHIERNVEFLSKELKVASPDEAIDRVFFISAREALASRIEKEHGTPTPSKPQN